MQGWVVGYSGLFQSLAHRGLAARLFREAAQLKTVATAVHAAGAEVLCAEVQKHAVSPAKLRRPTVSVVADVRQSAQSPINARVAEARGGVSICRKQKWACIFSIRYKPT